MNCINRNANGYSPDEQRKAIKNAQDAGEKNKSQQCYTLGERINNRHEIRYA